MSRYPKRIGLKKRELLEAEDSAAKWEPTLEVLYIDPVLRKWIYI